MKHLTLLLLPVLLLTACKHEQAAPKRTAEDKIPVKIMTLKAHDGNTAITASGQFTTDDETNLSFKTGGVIDRTFVKEGDAVHPGQLLATLKLIEIDAMVQQATLAADKAKRDYTRTTNLYKDSVATLEQMQNTKTAMDLAMQQLEAAKFNRSYSEIRAAKSGYVLRKMASEGQLVNPGNTVFQVNGAGTAGWVLRVGVGDKQWASIQPGNKATIRTDAGGDKEYEGAVQRKSQGVDPATGQFTIDVKLNEAKPSGIAAGMYGKASIAATTTKAGNIWEIPYESLLDANGSMGYVFTVNEDNTVTKTKVTIQGMEKDKVLISDGLQDIKAIVISGSAYLTDKSSISIIQ